MSSPSQPTSQGTSKHGVCKLCMQHKLLRRSHIVPEFFYKDAYDEKHRVAQLSLLNDQPRFLQKGLRERLLCDDCEQFLNDQYEKPFLAEWRGNLLPERLLPDQIHFTRLGNYGALKLLLLSVLYRADVSRLDAFGGVELGPHRDKLRRMIREGDPGGVEEYPVIGCLVVEDDGTRLPCVASPAAYRIKGCRAYAFVFGGVEWVYFVGSHVVRSVDQIGMRPGDRLSSFGASRLSELRTIRAMREAKARENPVG